MCGWVGVGILVYVLACVFMPVYLCACMCVDVFVCASVSVGVWVHLGGGDMCVEGV